MQTLSDARRAKAFSIRAFAAAADVSPQTVQTAENGKPVGLTSIRKMSQALGVEPMEIAEFQAVIQAPKQEN